MKSFKILMNELKVWMPPKGSGLGISRIKMPQVRSADYEEYVEYLADQNITFKAKDVDPNDLKPIQREFNIISVDRAFKKMLEIIPGAKLKSIIISKDNFIVDGHHRWIAHVNAKRKISVVQASVNMKELLSATNAYPKSYNTPN